MAVEEGYFHDTGEYSLTGTTATGSTSGIETEANSTRANADAVSSGSPISGQLSSSSDIDYYAIAASEAGTISVNFDSPKSGSSHYFTVSILDSSGTVLASQESGGDLSFSTGIEAAGAYYMAVEEGYFHDTGGYQITVSGQIASSENQFLQIVTPSITSDLELSLDENHPVDNEAYLAIADDVDNDPLIFSLSGTDADNFNINQTSGRLFLPLLPILRISRVTLLTLLLRTGGTQTPHQLRYL